MMGGEPLSDFGQPVPRKKLALHWKILFGLLVGVAAGLIANHFAQQPLVSDTVNPLDLDANGVHDRLDWWAINVADPLGRVFLRLIFMVVIPLVFSALALAVVGMGDTRRLGRIGLRTLAFTVVFSGIAVLLGVVLVNWIEPGRRLDPRQQEMLREQYAGGARDALVAADRAKPLKDVLLDIIPENPLQEMIGAVDGSSKGGGMLAVMLCALAVGIAMTFAEEETRTLAGWLEGLNAVSMLVIGFAMRLAPFGVACLVFAVTARLGLALVPPLMAFVLTVLLGFVVQLFVVYSLALWWFAGIRPGVFFSRISDAMLMAFGTSSSNATLPTALRVAEEELRLPPSISRFVLTIGATGNQNGSGLYQGVIVLFLAQVFNVDLTLGQQITVVLMSVLAGVGTAGVPGGSLPLIVVVLQSVGVPGEGIGIVLGVDRILDMCRTTLNVTGDLAIAACVSARSASDAAIE